MTMVEEHEEDQDEFCFCMSKCGGLTDAQIKMLTYHVKKKSFIGVGHPMGRGDSVRYPACFIGKAVNVIDKAGYYQLASGVIDRYIQDNHE